MLVGFLMKEAKDQVGLYKCWIEQRNGLDRRVAKSSAYSLVVIGFASSYRSQPSTCF